MHLHCVGLNHQTASLNLRERMAFDEEKTRAALACLGCGVHGQVSNACEMVILSTCNRVEIYTASPDSQIDSLLTCLADLHRIPRSEFEPHLYHLMDEQAVQHLFRVAAGLDSQVLGESQILGQVSQALDLARSQNTAGPIISRLFQAAIFAGKRVRAETHFGQNPASIPSLTAGLIARAVPHLDRAQVVLIGAGEMAQLVMAALRKRSTCDILVVNRSLARARELAQAWGAEATTFEHLEAALTKADCVVSSTGAPHTVIPLSLVAKAMQLRPERPLLAIDIAVPRDIDPQVGKLPGVGLIDLDSLNQGLEQSLAERRRAVPLVESILAEEVAHFLNFLKTLDVLPVIADLHQKAEAIRQNELEKSLRRLPDLSEGERASIEAMTRAIVNRLLDAPITRLRAEAHCAFAAEYTSVARTLFGLPVQGNGCELSGGPCPMATQGASEG
jgi:glutamyl-tRNA reductase